MVPADDPLFFSYTLFSSFFQVAITGDWTGFFVIYVVSSFYYCLQSLSLMGSRRAVGGVEWGQRGVM